MNRVWKYATAFGILVLTAILIGLNYFLDDPYYLLEVSSEEIKLDIADTVSERQLGLMGVEQMSNSRGMIFIWNEDVQSGFWMKDVLINLDMIFLDEEYRVVDINAEAVPCESREECLSYSPSKPYRYVIELNGGQAEELGIVKGAQLELTAFL